MPASRPFRPRCSAAARRASAIAGNPTARWRPARSGRPSGSRGSAAKRSSAITSLIMPTSGRRISPRTSRPPGFSSRRTTAKAESSSPGVMYWATEFMTTRSTDFSVHFPQVIERAHPDLGVRGKARDQPAAHARRGLGQIQLAAGLRHLCRRQGLAAGIIQHHRIGRGDVADDVPGDDLEMQVAMQPARIDRMRGIVIIDPVFHRLGVRQKRGFRSRNPCPYDALDGPATSVQRPMSGS